MLPCSNWAGGWEYESGRTPNLKEKPRFQATRSQKLRSPIWFLMPFSLSWTLFERLSLEQMQSLEQFSKALPCNPKIPKTASNTAPRDGWWAYRWRCMHKLSMCHTNHKSVLSKGNLEFQVSAATVTLLIHAAIIDLSLISKMQTSALRFALGRCRLWLQQFWLVRCNSYRLRPGMVAMVEVGFQMVIAWNSQNFEPSHECSGL